MRTSVMRRWVSLSWLCLLPLSACNCEDEISDQDPWALRDPAALPDLGPVVDLGLEPDASLEPDIAADLGPDLPEDLGPDLAPDMAVEPDMAPPLPPDVPWQPQVVAEVPRTQALTDRTSLGVGQDNTVWLGYHECTDSSCTSPWLTVAIQRPNT